MFNRDTVFLGHYGMQLSSRFSLLSSEAVFLGDVWLLGWTWGLRRLEVNEIDFVKTLNGGILDELYECIDIFYVIK